MKMKGLRQSNKGFTLAEICVTFVIVSILASITTFSLISWQHDSQYNKMEQNAELIYMALKNKMTSDKANGIGFDTDIDNLYCNSGDYEKYKNKNSVSDKAKTLFNYVSNYIYDKTILNAYINIEFDENKEIKSVYYSDRTLFFNAADGSLKAEFKNNDSNRYDNLVGAYLP